MANEQLKYLRLVENVDWSYFCLNQLYDEIGKQDNRSGLEIMIDNATGFSEAKNKERAALVLYHLKRILRYKKKLNKEYGCAHPLENTQKSISYLTDILKDKTN